MPFIYELIIVIGDVPHSCSQERTADLVPNRAHIVVQRILAVRLCNKAVNHYE
jgi:hypothetical protein